MVQGVEAKESYSGAKGGLMGITPRIKGKMEKGDNDDLDEGRLKGMSKLLKKYTYTRSIRRLLQSKRLILDFSLRITPPTQ